MFSFSGGCLHKVLFTELHSANQGSPNPSLEAISLPDFLKDLEVMLLSSLRELSEGQGGFPSPLGVSVISGTLKSVACGMGEMGVRESGC